MRITLAILLASLVAGSLLLLTGEPSPSWRPTGVNSETGEIQEFFLRVEPTTWELTPGFPTTGWGYNGEVPGPEIRVTEGDILRVHVRNYLPVPTTVHWHGVELPNAMDGVPGITQEAIAPGEKFIYEFPARPAGTRIYHSHQDSNGQMELGLYGALIIEPRHKTVEYDREYVAILDERALDFTPEVAMGQASLDYEAAGNGRGGALQYDFFLINGKVGGSIPPIEVAEGERVLVRVINVGNMPHAMHLHGHTFTVVATDGNAVPDGARLRKDTILVGPSERYDLEITGDNPGIWLFHCHMPHHAENGMVTTMNYAGAEPVISAGAPASSDDVVVVEGDQVSVDMLDNRFSPAHIQIETGTTVTWANKGDNRHNTLGLDKADWNSKLLERDASFSFTFTEPGLYHYICRQHILTGMAGSIRVVDKPIPKGG